jgi:hypothetical protein
LVFVLQKAGCPFNDLKPVDFAVEGDNKFEMLVNYKRFKAMVRIGLDWTGKYTSSKCRMIILLATQYRW